MNYFTKDSLKEKLNAIRGRGWIKTQRGDNDGGVGNTLEDLLGIEENNLPLPNTGEWEIKGQRADTKSLITLFHREPSPRAMHFVPKILLPYYGWAHDKAGTTHPSNEMSFRQTLSATAWTNRGFIVVVNCESRKIEISFNHKRTDTQKHGAWLNSVEKRVGLNELDPQPYWGFQDLFHKAGTKLNKTVYAIADRKHEDGIEYFHYSKFLMLEDFKLENFVEAIVRGYVLVDFDARTGHNHGTKFRLRQDKYPYLYGSVQELNMGTLGN